MSDYNMDTFIQAGEKLKNDYKYEKREPQKWDAYSVLPIEILKYGLNLGQQSIYLYLLHSSAGRGYCWNSQEDIALNTNVSRSYVSRCISGLIEKGLLVKHTIKKANNQENNVYLPALGILFSTSLTRSARRLKIKDMKAEPKGHEGLTKTAQYNKDLKLRSKINTYKGESQSDSPGSIFEGSKGTALSRILDKYKDLYGYKLPMQKTDIDSVHEIDVKTLDLLLRKLSLWKDYISSEDPFIESRTDQINMMINHIVPFMKYCDVIEYKRKNTVNVVYEGESDLEKLNRTLEQDKQKEIVKIDEKEEEDKVMNDLIRSYVSNL